MLVFDACLVSCDNHMTFLLSRDLSKLHLGSESLASLGNLCPPEHFVNATIKSLAPYTYRPRVPSLAFTLYNSS